MNTFPYIILLEGKLFVIELPEKPEFKGDYFLHMGPQRAYESARSAAIEKAVEVENPELLGFVNTTGMFYIWNSGNKERIKEGEEVRWMGSWEKMKQYKHLNTWHHLDLDKFSVADELELDRQLRTREVARLIAPEQGRDPQAPERIPSTEGVAIHEPILDAIHSDTYELSELNYPRNHAIDFATWYSGMGRAKVENAYSRYVNEVKS